MEQLKNALQKYKQGDYNSETYQSDNELKDACEKGKIFVVKGGLRAVDWSIAIVMWILGIVILIFAVPLLGLGISVLAIIIMVCGSLILLKFRNLLVLGPQGVMYRKVVGSINSFQWSEVKNLSAMEQTTAKARRIMRLTHDTNIPYMSILNVYCEMKTGDSKRFPLQAYIIKEFPKKIRKELYIKLFQNYFEKYS